MGETPDIDLQRSREAHVTVQYSIEGGIFNQHMDHCHTMMLAIALKAQRLLWPPSQDRDSYKVGYNRQHWSMVEASEIYDMESIAEYAASTYRAVLNVARNRMFSISAVETSSISHVYKLSCPCSLGQILSAREKLT